VSCCASPCGCPTTGSFIKQIVILPPTRAGYTVGIM
jgi:hypothetical protein